VEGFGESVLEAADIAVDCEVATVLPAWSGAGASVRTIGTSNEILAAD